MSVNEAWQGRRFKSDKYKTYSEAVAWLLPKKIDLPEPMYEIYFKAGFSTTLSDWDNFVKPTQDIIAKKYKFNDKLIRRAVIETEIVPKGKEYFEFEILHYDPK